MFEVLVKISLGLAALVLPFVAIFLFAWVIRVTDCPYLMLLIPSIPFAYLIGDAVLG